MKLQETKENRVVCQFVQQNGKNKEHNRIECTTCPLNYNHCLYNFDGHFLCNNVRKKLQDDKYKHIKQLIENITANIQKNKSINIYNTDQKRQYEAKYIQQQLDILQFDDKINLIQQNICHGYYCYTCSVDSDLCHQYKCLECTNQQKHCHENIYQKQECKQTEFIYKCKINNSINHQKICKPCVVKNNFNKICHSVEKGCYICSVNQDVCHLYQCTENTCIYKKISQEQ